MEKATRPTVNILALPVRSATLPTMMRKQVWANNMGQQVACYDPLRIGHRYIENKM